MATFDDSKPKYNDRFKESNQWAKILFSPGRSLFQSELNELQSSFQSQISLLGNSEFREGSVISGMGVVPQGIKVPDDSKNDDEDDGINPNLVSFSALSSYNSKLDITKYKTSGSLGVTSTATTSNSFPGFQIVVSGVGSGEMTISFTIKKTSGTLYNLSAIYQTDLEVERYLIDGRSVKTALNNEDATLLVDDGGNQINLSDEAEHVVTITFGKVNKGSYPITFVANRGYNAVNEGIVDFTINLLKAEDGADATKWLLSPTDSSVSDGVERNQGIRVLSGYLFIGGMIRRFNQQDISITGKGTELLGVTVNEDVVTANEDPSLLDHTTGAISEWEQGADRLHYDVVLTYNDPNSTTLFTLTDGKLSNDVNKPDMAVLNDVLAKRTNDESGSYRVNGFNMWSKKDPLDSSVVDVVVDSGTAYVLGYQIVKGTSTTIPVSKATGTKDDPDEVFLYSEKNYRNGQLANQPVKSVNQVSGNVQVTDEAVNRNASSTVNDVLANPAYQIDKIYWVDSDKKQKVYQNGVDYALVNGNEIKWLVTENAVEPPTGGTYYVTYKYQRVFTKNVDYQVITEGEDANATTIVSFDDMKGEKPIEGSQVHVSYTYFLARIDVLTLDKDGNFKLIAGQPDKLSTAKPPLQVDPLVLQIGYVTVFPNSDSAKTQLATVTRITFTGLQDVVSRLQHLEQSMAIQALNDSAMENTDPLLLKNVFADNFTDVDKADLGNKDFTASYLFNTGEITVPIKASTALQPAVVDTASSLHKFSHMVTTPFSEYAVVSQPAATGTKNINPYQVFNVLGTMHISPEVDNWIETNSTTVYSDGGNKTINQGRWWIHGTSSADQAGYKAVDDTVTMDDGQNLSQFLSKTGGMIANASGTLTSNLGTKTVDSEVQFIRPNTVTFKAENLIPLEDNLKLTFDGVETPIKPAEGYMAGSDSGSIMTNADGVAEGTFDIPSGIKTGVREVKLASTDVSATATYTAQGTNRENQTMIQRSRVTINFSDPLAQSFGVESNCILTSVDLWFASKPSESSTKQHRSDVVVQIRRMGDQGYPSREILSETTLTPDQIQISADAMTSTHIPLPDPLQVTAGDSLAIVVISDSADYNLYVAQSGAQRLDGSHAAIGQPYVDGVLFYSSNGQTWSAQQDTDMKFRINAGTFSDTGIVAFDTIYPGREVYRDGLGNPIVDEDGKQIPLSINQLVLLANYLTPGNTGMNWQVKIVSDDQPDNITVNDVDWEPLNIDAERDLLEAAREIQFRALFNASNKLSPILALDSLSLATFLMTTKAEYLSRTIDMTDEAFNHVRVQYEAYEPGASKVTPYFSIDGGKTWIDLSKIVDTTKTIDRHFVQHTYEVQLYDQAGGDHTTATSFKVRLDLSAQNGYTRPTVRRLRSNMTLEDGDGTGTVIYKKPDPTTTTSTTTVPPTTSTTVKPA
ncbi:DUF4815 domain-containing protein [Secundilactobacillus kimchicus]|uniref:DUF4815 domain-containing protein n=1 Tax=Secundilactobacillus kimchicus TaxID=528209 RepID=UPI001C00BCEF|nr:DUF4815 domain-containing protein [Secundilactobacillus kimchicus]MBT9670556.1 DUF4815 domain-containing protein [Secundilactobacillus kimchicus]